MKFSEPIKNIKVIEEMKEYLKDTCERDYILFLLCINTGFKIEDVLQLKVMNVKDDRINIREKETGHHHSFFIKKPLKKQLNKYIEGKKDESYLFEKAISRKNDVKEIPMERREVFNMLNRLARRVGYSGVMGTETLRKTFGYHVYKRAKEKDKRHVLIALTTFFDFRNSKETIEYLNLFSQEDEDRIMRGFLL